MTSHASGREVAMLAISYQEYNSLLKIDQKYHALRQALLAGGVTNESLDVLIGTSLPTLDPSQVANLATDPPANASASLTWHPAPDARPFIPRSYATTTSGRRQGFPRLQTDLDACNPSPPETACIDGDEMQEELFKNLQEEEQTLDENVPVRRSLVISGLSPATTLHSVAKVLRGGIIWEMFLSKRNASAHVSFVDPLAAHKFFEYAQTNGIYVQGKKVQVFWDDQQRWIRPDLVNRIAFAGLTRNLVIRFARPEWTAQSIREDLDHIHQLEIVDIFFRNGHAFISLNSIQHALTARSCMQSRLKYKRWKMDSWTDDCAQPLCSLPPKDPQYPAAFKTATISRNRFDLLYQGSEESQESVSSC